MVLRPGKEEIGRFHEPRYDALPPWLIHLVAGVRLQEC
jgi:hypothetical protein